MGIGYMAGYVTGFVFMVALMVSPVLFIVTRRGRRVWEIPLFRLVTGRKKPGKPDRARIAQLEQELERIDAL